MKVGRSHPITIGRGPE